ncbi:MAG: transcription antitermination factor NusB [Gammaproteobacteria bacterium]|nr:transcription antitermination factor NusB [Gammaproteobacteria bacterium]
MKPSERRKARRLALQAIYSWQMSGNAVAEIELEFLTNQDIKGVDVEYFRKLLLGVTQSSFELDDIYRPYLNRGVNEVDQIDRAILRLATYELKELQDTPFKVIINEAIELAKSFAADDSHKFVNGVLDKTLARLRKQK